MSAVPSLADLRSAGVLRDVDVHFAQAVARLAGATDPLVLLGLAVASRAPGAGHVCADLAAPHRLVRAEDDRSALIAWPEPGEWIAALHSSAVVTGGGSLRRPLVLDGARLYLYRYWCYQQQVVRALGQRAGDERTDIDEALLHAGLESLFPPAIGGNGAPLPDAQRVAAAVAVLRSLAIVTGGPGTGKTTVVVKILALIAAQWRASGAVSRPRIALAAPTGKAAARMGDALRAGMERLALPPDVRECIPGSATTIHRLLGVDPARPTRFRHHAGNPLAVDLLVVDEASMVDLALMAKLLDAVPPAARLIVLGDGDQLASVEAGAILGDICAIERDSRSAAFVRRLASLGCEVPAFATAEPVPLLGDCIVRLTRSHRYREDGGIGALARAVNGGDADRALALLAPSAGAYDRRATGSVGLLEPPAGARDAECLREIVVAGYRRFLQLEDPKAVLHAFDEFRVLCAHRRGSFGVEGLNAAIADWLARAGLLATRGSGDDGWYHGRPVIITENDPQLGLYNGDTGVILTLADCRPRAYFHAADGDGIRALAATRLPPHETVFAMTVHKSQGSEFDEVVLALPARRSAILTRELLYTAITRARASVLVAGSPDVLRAAIDERVQRASGLREQLRGATVGAVNAGSAAAIVMPVGRILT